MLTSILGKARKDDSDEDKQRSSKLLSFATSVAIPFTGACALLLPDPQLPHLYRTALLTRSLFGFPELSILAGFITLYILNLVLLIPFTLIALKGRGMRSRGWRIPCFVVCGQVLGASAGSAAIHWLTSFNHINVSIFSGIGSILGSLIGAYIALGLIIPIGKRSICTLLALGSVASYAYVASDYYRQVQASSLVASWHEHRNSVTALWPTGDGEILSSSTDGSIHRWKLNSRESSVLLAASGDARTIKYANASRILFAEEHSLRQDFLGGGLSEFKVGVVDSQGIFRLKVDLGIVERPVFGGDYYPNPTFCEERDELQILNPHEEMQVWQISRGKMLRTINVYQKRQVPGRYCSPILWNPPGILGGFPEMVTLDTTTEHQKNFRSADETDQRWRSSDVISAWVFEAGAEAEAIAAYIVNDSDEHVRNLYIGPIDRPENHIVLSNFPSPLSEGGICLSPNGATVAVALENGSIEVRSLNSGSTLEILHKSDLIEGNIEVIAFSEDGSLLISGTRTGQVSIWRLSDEVRRESFGVRSL